MDLQSNQTMSETQAGLLASHERMWLSYLVKTEVPEHLHGGLARYLVHRIRPGSFLTAVLENDLKMAVAKADSTSRRALPELVDFLYQLAPRKSWGSVEAVEAWVKRTEVAS